MKREKLPKGFKCECGKTHKYPGYVYAHWNVEFIHPCTPGCGTKHSVYAGKALLIKAGK